MRRRSLGLLLAMACLPPGFGAVSPPATASPAAPPASGIRGLVLIGPTCPVEPIQPAPECGDRPFVAMIEIRTTTGRLLRTVRSNRLGRFTVGLPAGVYVLRPRAGPGIARPIAARRSVSVLPRRFTSVRILYDSGIRFVTPALR